MPEPPPEKELALLVGLLGLGALAASVVARRRSGSQVLRAGGGA